MFVGDVCAKRIQRHKQGGGKLVRFVFRRIVFRIRDDHISIRAIHPIRIIFPVDEVMPKFVREGEIDPAFRLDRRVVENAPATVWSLCGCQCTFKSLKRASLDQCDWVIGENLMRIILGQIDNLDRKT